MASSSVSTHFAFKYTFIARLANPDLRVEALEELGLSAEDSAKIQAALVPYDNQPDELAKVFALLKAGAEEASTMMWP